MFKMNHINDNSNMKQDKIFIRMQNKAVEPLYWPAPEGCQIFDLQSQHYDDVLCLIKWFNYYWIMSFNKISSVNIKCRVNTAVDGQLKPKDGQNKLLHDPMCKATNFHRDDLSVQNYLDLIRVWMRDTTSLVAISSRSGRVVGTVIARINSTLDKSMTYSRIQIIQGESLGKIMNLKNTLIKQADVFNQLNCDMIFRVYILCIHPTYQNRYLESALLEACIQIVIASEIPVIAGMFSSSDHQSLAEKLGFKKLSEIFYSQWIVNNEIIFDNPGIRNYSVAFMGMETPSLDYLMNLRQVKEEEIYEKQEKRRRSYKHGKLKIKE